MTDDAETPRHCRAIRVDQRRQTTSSLSRAGVDRRHQDAGAPAKLAVCKGGGEGKSSPEENEERTK